MEKSQSKTTLNRILAFVSIVSVIIVAGLLIDMSVRNINTTREVAQKNTDTNKTINLAIDVPKAEWVDAQTKDELRIYFTLVNSTDKTLRLLQEDIFVTIITNDTEQVNITPKLEQGESIDLPAGWDRSHILSIVVPHKASNIHHYLALRIGSRDETQNIQGNYSQFHLMALYNMMPREAQGNSESTPSTTVLDNSLQLLIDNFLLNKEVLNVKLPLTKISATVPLKATVEEVHQTSQQVEGEMGGTYTETSDGGARCYKLDSDLSINTSTEGDCTYDVVKFEFWSNDRLSKITGTLKFYNGTYPVDLTDVGDYQLEKATISTVNFLGKQQKLVSLTTRSFFTATINGKAVTIEFIGNEQANTKKVLSKILESIQ